MDSRENQIFTVNIMAVITSTKGSKLVSPIVINNKDWSIKKGLFWQSPKFEEHTHYFKQPDKLNNG